MKQRSCTAQQVSCARNRKQKHESINTGGGGEEKVVFKWDLGEKQANDNDEMSNLLIGMENISQLVDDE